MGGWWGGKGGERGEVARWEMSGREVRWQCGKGWGEGWGGKVGKVGERGQVARGERWGREVRWQGGKGGGERSGSEVGGKVGGERRGGKVGKVGERGGVWIGLAESRSVSRVWPRVYVTTKRTCYFGWWSDGNWREDLRWPGWEWMGRERRKMGCCSWLVSCRLIRLNPRAWWGREKCLAQRLRRAMCPG